MKILHFQKVSDAKSAVRAFFSFEHAGIIFCAWKIIKSKSGAMGAYWLAPPKILLFPGEGAAPVSVITIRMPKELIEELRDLVLPKMSEP